MWKGGGDGFGSTSHTGIQVGRDSSISLLCFQKLMGFLGMRAGKERLDNCTVSNCLNQEVKCVTLLTLHWPVHVRLSSKQCAG